MENLIPVNYDSEQPTVSARELYKKLNIGTKFTTWFERMKAYGFSEGNEFFPEVGETSEQGGRPATDYQISIDMAKQICMIQRTPEGKLIRQYFIDLEKAWNTPEQVFARALRIRGVAEMITPYGIHLFSDLQSRFATMTSLTVTPYGIPHRNFRKCISCTLD